ncbi:MAG: hypothetical protein K9J82_01190 [Methylotenera sp.]|nr:hypothetical protein [Methylotenera sp.]
MSIANCAPASETHTPLDRRVIFTPFTWHHRAQTLSPVSVDGGRVAEFAGGVRDVSAGVRTVMQIIERDDIEADNDDGQGNPTPALLGVQHKADLLRLCTWALDRLEADSNRMVDYLDNAQPITRGAHCPS